MIVIGMPESDELVDWEGRIAACLVSAGGIAAEMATMGYTPDDALVTAAALLIHHAKIYNISIDRVTRCVEHIHMIYDMPQEMCEGLIMVYAKAREAHERSTKL